MYSVSGVLDIKVLHAGIYMGFITNYTLLQS